MATFDASAFVTAVRRHARAPSSGTSAPGWADSDLLALANERVRVSIVPRLLKAREEFLVVVADQTLTAGTPNYSIPRRAILGKLREVQLVDSAGEVKNLTERSPEALDGLDTTSNNGDPEWYYFRGNEVVLVPAPDASTWTTLRLHYFRRLNRLVPVSEVMTITSVASAPTYAGSKPASILTTTPCDVVSATEPFVSLSDSNTPSAVVANTSVTFSSSVTGVAVGDYVCLAGEAPVLQLPPEFFDLLVYETAEALLAPGTDPEALANVVGLRKSLEAEVFGALSGDRNEGESGYVVNSVW